MKILQALKGWREYRTLPAEWRNIVFYSESGQDWHYFAPLIEVLNGRLERRVTYVTSDNSDPGLAREHGLYKAICLPEGFFLTLHFNMQKADLVVLTMMDLDNLQLKKSINPVHYVYLFHALGSTHMVDHADSYDAYDSLFCVGPHHVEELRKREAMENLPARNLFEYGHPRLEDLMQSAQEYERDRQGEGPNEPPKVLIAPTWGEHSIFNLCGEELVSVLLDAGYHVIVRPHYQTTKLTPGVIRGLKDRFAGHAGIEFQDRMGENDSLLHSDILICDWSAMAIEYALGLEKPVLYVDVPRRVRNPDWQELGIEPLESSFRAMSGAVIDPRQLDQAPAIISDLLERRGEFRQKMKHSRSRLVFNIGESAELGAREIVRLADKTMRQRATGAAGHD